jgi:hypothetical protein
VDHGSCDLSVRGYESMGIISVPHLAAMIA